MKTMQFDVAIQDHGSFFSAEVPAIRRAYNHGTSVIDVLNKTKGSIENVLKGAAARNEKTAIQTIDIEALKQDEDYKDRSWHTVEVDERCMFKNNKRERRERRPFGIGFFTPGTVCEVNIGMCEEPEIVTVRSLIKNGADSYVILTGVMEMLGESEHERGINIGHVSQIIRHVPGRLKFDENYAQQHRHEFFAREHNRSYDPFLAKHPSQYKTMSAFELLTFITSDYLKPDQVLDGHMLLKLLMQQGVLQKKYLGEEHGHPQTYQRDPSGDIPVCSDCRACVMPNRGQGTICNKCANEVDMHFAHDLN